MNQQRNESRRKKPVSHLREEVRFWLRNEKLKREPTAKEIDAAVKKQFRDWLKNEHIAQKQRLEYATALIDALDEGCGQ